MRKSDLLALIPMILMLIATFVPIASATGPPQPPVDTTTLHTGTIGWGPVVASPHKSYDTGSGELIFNTYDTLITMGAPVTNLWGEWEVHEQYWEFEPSLATNVPDRQEITQDFMSIPFVETIYVRNELPLDPDWITDPECTWWEDAMLEPIDSYHLYLWDDGGNQHTGHPPTPGGVPNGVLDFCDWVYMNAYWWAPEVPLEVEDKECQWWHVLDVIEVEPDVWIMILEKTPDGVVDPVDPECTWLIPIPPYHPDYDPAIVGPRLYHINGWIDNNPDEVCGPCDVVYIMEFENVTVHWQSPYGEIEGWILVPITKRTWHVEDVDCENGYLDLHRFYYDFLIPLDSGINFIESYSGAIVDTFDIYDVEYSLKKGLVMDHYGGPMWMFYKPLFDTMGSDDWDTGDPADAIELAYLIKDAIETFNETTNPVLRINLGIAFPDIAFKQILSQGWAAIQSKEYSLSIGCWDGELFLDSGYLPDTVKQNCIPDWFEYWRHLEYGPYEAEWVGEGATGNKRYAGTGPYYVGILDAANNLVVLLSHDIDHCGDDYFKGWPSEANSLVGARMQDYLKEIHIEYIELWATRRAAFEACEIDVCAVPRAFMTDLLDDFGEPINPSIKTIKKISPVLAMAAIFYNFDIAGTSTGIYTGEFPGGIPTNFFNNTFIRAAFSYAFNRSRYLAEAYLGEAIVRETPDIYGLSPDYYIYGPDPPWTYDVDYEKAKQALKNAMFDTDGDNVTDTSAWDAGFKMDLLYNTGNDQRRIACYYLRDFFALLSGDPERAGKPPFTLVVKNVDWPTYITALIHYELTIFVLGWQADFADADNWKRPYMHTYGDFSYFTSYSIYKGWDEPGPRTGMNKDQLIDLAVKTPDGPLRAEMYADLDDIYIRDNPSLPIAQPTGRRWQKCWVRGWYYNALYPSSYYYHMYKKDACWSDVTGPSIGTPDGVNNMRDIGYIAGHFLESQPPPYDDSWAPGSYGCAGADVYGDRRIDMRDIGFACLHFGHTSGP